MKVLYSFIVFLVLLSGCSTTKPTVVEYKLSLEDLKASGLSDGCKDKSLKVTQAFSSNSLMSLDMNYMIGKSKIYSYSQAQWDNSPNKEITSQIVQLLRDSKLFKTTHNSKSIVKSDMILETTIEDFMQYYDEKISTSYVKVSINMTLLDAKTAKVIASKTFSTKLKSTSLDAEGGVDALNKALRDVLEDSLKFLSEVCK